MCVPTPGLLICLCSPKHLSLVAFDLLLFICQRVFHCEPAAFPNDRVKMAYIICPGANGQKERRRRQQRWGLKCGPRWCILHLLSEEVRNTSSPWTRWIIWTLPSTWPSASTSTSHNGARFSTVSALEEGQPRFSLQALERPHWIPAGHHRGTFAQGLSFALTTGETVTLLRFAAFNVATPATSGKTTMYTTSHYPFPV